MDYYAYQWWEEEADDNPYRGCDAGCGERDEEYVPVSGCLHLPIVPLAGGRLEVRHGGVLMNVEEWQLLVQSVSLGVLVLILLLWFGRR